MYIVEIHDVKSILRYVVLKTTWWIMQYYTKQRKNAILFKNIFGKKSGKEGLYRWNLI